MNKEIKEQILSIISSEFYSPLSPDELFNLVMSGKEHLVKEFFKTLCEMEEDFEIFVSKKGKISLPEEGLFVRGTFSSSSHGKFGFVSSDEGEFFVPPQFRCGVMNGDKVVAKRISPKSRYYGKGNEVEIVAVSERGIVEFTGEFEGFSNKGRLFGEVRPDSDKLDFVATVVGSPVMAKTGDKVVCKITKYPLFDGDRICVKVTDCLGKHTSKEANYRAILREHSIPSYFDDIILKEAEDASSELISAGGRVDLRDRCIFTIDSESAKDLDDAISIEKTDTGYVLGVHIADVSHYVREGSLLDNEAMSRGTSVYFTDKVVPMLPSALSNGACSLNGGVDRYALSALITLDMQGNIKDTRLCNSIINSKARGVYSELNDIIDNGENSEFYAKYRHIIGDFEKMLELYRILKDKSERAGAMDLESDEAEIILDEGGHPIEIVKRERGESEKLIEQFMLCANRAVAEFLYKHSLPCVYRVHENPDPDKIRAFSIFASNLGIDTSSIKDVESVTPLDLAKVLESAREKGKADVISSVLLRSLMKAKYLHEPKGHFGLATKLYCHFTSPIRRYPDLTVHRIVKKYLEGCVDKSSVSKLCALAERSAKRSSENELRALYAEREIDELYKAVYMGDFIDEEMDATISSVTSFGFFAKCDNLCEGLVPIASLGAPFYFDEASLTLSSGRRTFALGQRVKIKVVDSDVVTRRVTFALVSCDEADSTPSVPFNRPATVKKSSKSSHAHHSSKPKHKKSGHSRKSHSHKGRGKR